MAMIDVKRFSNCWLSSRVLDLPLKDTTRLKKSVKSPPSLAYLFVVLVMLFPLMGRSQELAATLSGTVTDSTGAVIPNASITITLNGVNGTERVVQSDASGYYTATNLIAGTYSVKVVAQGFETFYGKNVVLNVAEKHSFNVPLKAGSVSTTITVDDNPVSVDTESSAQAGTISGVQVRELELSSRNFEQLVTLQPGVVNQLGDEVSASNTALSVNGARTSANNWTVDGADINDSGSNQTILNVPSIDAIQEFTLQRGSYDAGYGRSGGGQVLVATKSGTSAFHGDVYEFVRNTALDANDWTNKNQQVAAGLPNTPSVNHHNDYGFTIGGPLFIPKVYNRDKKKTFIFWSEEWRKITAPGSGTAITPTTGEVGGVIPDTYDATTNVYTPFAPQGPNTCPSMVYDAATHTTTIPASCNSQNSSVYLKNVFVPNATTNGGAINEPYSAEGNISEDILRVDHYFSDKVHFFARGMSDDMPVGEPLGLWGNANYPGLVNTSVDSPGKNVVANLTWTISPTIVNEAEFVYAQGTYYSTINPGQVATSTSVMSALTNNWVYTPDLYGNIPSVSIASGITGFSIGSAPWHERNLDRTYFDNLSITHGKHTLRAGFQFQQMIKTENAVDGNPGFTFADFGNFLLGNVSSYSQQSSDVIPDLNYVNSEAYVQDDWKITHKLTINLGVRWSDFPTPTDTKDTLSNFDPLLFNGSNAPGIDPATGNFASATSSAQTPNVYSNGLIFPKGKTCAAAQAISATAQCSPYGGEVNPNYKTNFGPRVGFAYNPDGRGLTSIRGGFGIFYDRLLNGIFEQNAFYNPPLVQTASYINASFDAVQGTGAAVVNLTPNPFTSTGNPGFQVPSYANYNVSLQRLLLPTTTLEIAYVGNVARHLLGEVDFNQPTMSARSAVSQNTDVNAVRPYLGWTYGSTRIPEFTNNYNSLQVSFNHKAHGLTLGAAYTWSKDLTTNPADRKVTSSDTYDLKLDYGPATTNTPQVLEVNYIYELPFFKQQRGFEGHILGGWELSGVSSFVSGSSISLTQNVDPFACPEGSDGLCLASSPAGTSLRGLGITGVQGGDPYATPRLDQVAPVQMTKTHGAWFSTSSFSPAAGHFGSEHTGAILGPGMQKWDIATFKNMNLGEHLRFQLRGEYFNAFNHTNWNTVDQVQEDSTFGQITSTHEPRIIQIGAKLNF
jgi:hypothetical protein